MFDATSASAIAKLDLGKIVLAMGSLGTAAYGLVDASKALLWGGVSNRGFGEIEKVIAKFIPPLAGGSNPSALALPSVKATLRANWINGMALADQKSVAKALIKLNLTDASSRKMGVTAGVDPDLLFSVAQKLATGTALTTQETDVYGRFDLLLAAQLDQGYQRADQQYRNTAKLAAVVVSVALALLGAKATGNWNSNWGLACIVGLLATPLAPVAKDLASAIQAGAKVAQSLKR
jgi:hypothetical protein